MATKSIVGFGHIGLYQKLLLLEEKALYKRKEDEEMKITIEMNKMRITIEASEKEIAALVLALQEQQFEKCLKEKMFKKSPEDAF